MVKVTLVYRGNLVIKSNTRICMYLQFRLQDGYFNVDHYIYCCVIDWNKLLYYCNTQRDGFYQSLLLLLNLFSPIGY